MNKNTPKTLYKLSKPIAFKINTKFLIVFILFFFLIFFFIGVYTVDNMIFILNVGGV